ncbi:MAG TPA: hypothetical protein VFJ29_08000 [Candidatus Kapabacteria bacterium]|nr:hypothetical protein [Candidatus Kapabacteria bacterium]
MKYFLFCCIITTALTLQAQTSLRYHMAPGQQLKYNSTTTTETATSAMGQDMNITTDVTSMMSMNAESAAGDQITFTTKLDSCGMKMQPDAPGMSDSIVSNALKGFIGKRTRIVMSTNGKVLSATMVDTPEISNPLLSGLSKSFAKYNEMFGFLPENSVKIGDTWKAKRNDTTDIGSSKDTGMMARTGTVYTTVNVTCTLQRFADTLGHHCAVIGNTYTMTTEGNMSMMGMDMSIDGDGKGKSTFYFDAEKGVLVASVSKMEMTQNMAMTGQQSMVIPSSTTITTNMTLMP